MYKFFFRKVMKEVNSQIEYSVNKSLDSTLDRLDLLKLFWWLKNADKSNFELQFDVDGPKIMMFINTLFMSNLSISKKLSHSDSYIS